VAWVEQALLEQEAQEVLVVREQEQVGQVEQELLEWVDLIQL
jgi:hypothetical protein